MEKYLSTLSKCTLFQDISENNIKTMLKCLSAQTKEYPKNSFIFDNNLPKTIGIVLNGEIELQKIDFNGNLNIVQTLYPTDIFGEAIVISERKDVIAPLYAKIDTIVLMIDYKKVLSVCSNTCKYHMELINNMLKIMAHKILNLNRKLEHISKRTTKEKLLSYLNERAVSENSPSFSIPYNRQELADYLAVDRSGLSNELCKLRDEGILVFNKNYFTLKQS